MKKTRNLLAALLLVGSLGIASPNFISYAEYGSNIQVERSSVWMQNAGGNDRYVGGNAYLNGELVNVQYWVQSKNGLDYIYQKKNGSDWVFLGTRGPTNVTWNMPSEDSIYLFIKIANAAAQSQGYDHF